MWTDGQSEIERSRLLLYGGARPSAEQGRRPAALDESVGGGPPAALRTLLLQGGLPAGALRGYLWRAGGMLAALAAAGWAVCGAAGMLLAAAGGALEYLRLKRRVFRRAAAFESD